MYGMHSLYPSHKYWPGGQIISVSLPVRDNRGLLFSSDNRGLLFSSDNRGLIYFERYYGDGLAHDMQSFYPSHKY